MKQTPKGVGIIGAGMIAGIHADAIKNSEKTTLKGVYDINPEAAQTLIEKCGANARVCASVEELVADPGIEIINVATPNHLHTPYVLQAAQHGKHVLCEKPPAMSLQETDQMIQACQKAQVRFGIFVQSRVQQATRSIREAVQKGRFGKILRVEALMKWFRGTDYYQLAPWRADVSCGAGVTIQQAFHYYDLLQALMGPALRVEAEMSNIAHPGIPVEDTLEARVTFADGVIGNIFASTALWPGTDMRIEIYGSEGCAIMEGSVLKTWKFKDEHDEDDAIRAMASEKKQTAGGAYNALPSAGHQTIIDDCVDAINQGHEVCTPCHEVRASLEMALAMYYSDKTKQAVELPIPHEADLWKPKD